MTFKKFEEIVKAHRPEITVYPHSRSEFVGVQFTPTGRIYDYAGSYVQVLNRLGIKAITKADLHQLQDHLSKLEAEDGKESIWWWGEVVDNTKLIQECKQQIDEIMRTYIVIG